MKVVWSPESLDDLTALHAYISLYDQQAAEAMVNRIVLLVEDNLPRFPQMGRPGRMLGSRELIVPGTPYIVPYRVKAQIIEIGRVYHAARRWPDTL